MSGNPGEKERQPICDKFICVMGHWTLAEACETTIYVRTTVSGYCLLLTSSVHPIPDTLLLVDTYHAPNTCCNYSSYYCCAPSWYEYLVHAWHQL